MGAGPTDVQEPTDETLLRKLSNLLELWEGVQFAYLFGSHAKGTPRPDSDLDLAVFFDHDDSAWDSPSLQELLTRELDIPVQVISLDRRPPLRFLHRMLSEAVVIRDGEGRTQWEMQVVRALGEEGIVERRDPRTELLDSMDESASRILNALPLLQELDLEGLRQNDPQAIRDFIGTYLMLFEPLETIARRMATYARLAPWVEEQSTTLKQHLKLLVDVLGLDERAYTCLSQLSGLRNRVAHAYWELAEEELSQSDLEDMPSFLQDLTGKLWLFVVSEREKIGQGD